MVTRISPARLLVLGAVQRRGRAHGYQVSRDLLSWRADYWAHVGAGSVYQALRTLTKHRHLLEVGVQSGGGGPERTLYSITEAGVTELLHLIRLSLSDPDAGPDALNAAFAMLDRLQADEIATLLDYRARALRRRLPNPDEQGETEISAQTPKRISALVDLYVAQTRTELEWATRIARQIVDGTFDPAG